VLIVGSFLGVFIVKFTRFVHRFGEICSLCLYVDNTVLRSTIWCAV